MRAVRSCDGILRRMRRCRYCPHGALPFGVGEIAALRGGWDCRPAGRV